MMAETAAKSAVSWSQGPIQQDLLVTNTRSNSYTATTIGRDEAEHGIPNLERHQRICQAMTLSHALCRMGRRSDDQGQGPRWYSTA